MGLPIAIIRNRNTAPVGGGSPTPPLPAFDNIAAVWGLYNWNPVGYPAGVGVNYENAEVETNDALFTEGAPYPLDWAVAGSAPYLVNTWADQNNNANDITQIDPARPTLDATNEWIEFDGVQTGMTGGGELTGFFGSTTGTIYGRIQPLSLAETGVILETNMFADRATTIKQVSIRMVAGVLTASVFDETAVVALPNTKTKVLSTTDPIFFCFQWDTDVATPALQTSLFVNNLATGVLSPASADLSGLVIGAGVPNVGARNNAASNFITARMWTLYVSVAVDDVALRTQFFNYQQYLASL